MKEFTTVNWTIDWLIDSLYAWLIDWLFFDWLIVCLIVWLIDWFFQKFFRTSGVSQCPHRTRRPHECNGGESGWHNHLLQHRLCPCDAGLHREIFTEEERGKIFVVNQSINHSSFVRCSFRPIPVNWESSLIGCWFAAFYCRWWSPPPLYSNPLRVVSF